MEVLTMEISMSKRWMRITALVLALGATTAQAKDVVEVWRTATCGCCKAWIRHMQDNGFSTKEVIVESTSPMRRALGIPIEMGSCHTAKVRGYALEGHVPAADVKRLLAEKPKAAGLAVPGMPLGSPGMEVPGRAADKYEVLLVGTDGRASVFARH
jgi:hypothetical protein